VIFSREANGDKLFAQTVHRETSVSRLWLFGAAVFLLSAIVWGFAIFGAAELMERAFG